MSKIWTPHATVACIVKRHDLYLMVEERSHGKTVFNQPAGHVDEGESIFEAALRETREETGWHVKLTGLVGLYVYTAPQNGVCYHRYCFCGEAIEESNTPLDDDIIAAHWLSKSELENKLDQLRSPLVMQCINDAESRPAYPLSLIYEHQN